MVLFGITAGIGAIIMIVGFVVVFSKRAQAPLKALPIFEPMIYGIILVVIGLIAGGGGLIAGQLSGATGSILGGADDGMVSAQETVIEKCNWIAGTGIAGNITVRQDPNSNNRVFVDVDESDYDSNGQALTEIAQNFSCTRAGQIGEDGTARIVVKGSEFSSENDVASATVFNILTTTARPSSVFSGENQQTVYVSEGVVTTSSTKEEADLTFAEADKTLQLSILGELSVTGYQNLNNNTNKDIVISQRFDDGSENVLAFITIVKLA